MGHRARPVQTVVVLAVDQRAELSRTGVVVELTAEAGDVVVMLPWTMHNLAMNCAATPRFMVTHSIYRTVAPI
jgi:hypothetical protein